jgi:hypothetical protein
MKSQFNLETNPGIPTDTNNNQSHDDASCICPEVGSRLVDYIVNLLDNNVELEVERHLADCKYCKEKYLLVLRVQREAALRVKNTFPNDDALSSKRPGARKGGSNCD